MGRRRFVATRKLVVVCAAAKVCLGFVGGPILQNRRAAGHAKQKLARSPGGPLNYADADVVAAVVASMGDPQTRFSCIAAVMSAAFVSQIAQSPLAREKRKAYARPANVSKAAWRAEDVAKWQLRPGEGAHAVVWFLREWARGKTSQGLLRSATVEDIDGGVRIRYVRRPKYLSAAEERRLEARFERQREVSPDLARVAVADSIYTYPKRRTRAAGGGVDVVVLADGSDVISAVRSSYELNEAIKENSERRLVAALDRDLAVVYGAKRLPRAGLYDDDDDEPRPTTQGSLSDDASRDDEASAVAPGSSAEQEESPREEGAVSLSLDAA